MYIFKTQQVWQVDRVFYLKKIYYSRTYYLRSIALQKKIYLTFTPAYFCCLCCYGVIFKQCKTERYSSNPEGPPTTSKFMGEYCTR